MDKPFKLEVMMEGVVYVFDLDMSRALLEKLETFGDDCRPACKTLRRDLRRALRIADGLEAPAAPAPEDEGDGTEEGGPAAGVCADVAQENAEACGDCRKPRCRFCDKEGERVAGIKGADGRVTEWYYVCRTEGCLAKKSGVAQPLRFFAGGGK